eukprot:5874472-Amphidinium_carterae.1
MRPTHRASWNLKKMVKTPMQDLEAWPLLKPAVGWRAVSPSVEGSEVTFAGLGRAALGAANPERGRRPAGQLAALGNDEETSANQQGFGVEAVSHFQLAIVVTVVFQIAQAGVDAIS